MKMQEIYASLILNENHQPITEDNVKKVLSSVGANVDESKLKVLVASLKDVDIDEALKEAVSFAAQPAVAAPTEKKEEKSEEEEAKAAESASQGLSSLFG